MKPCEEYISKIEKELPEMCRVKDLIKVGVFNSATAAVEARTTGNSPDYFQMSKRGRVLYPRNGVVQWLREKINAKYNENVLCSPEKATSGS
jgi:hypothetical protein